MELWFLATVVCNNPILYFNGFICTTPKNIIMYDAIKHIYNCNLSDLCKDYFAIVQEFKKIVDKYKNNFKVNRNSNAISLIIFIFKEIIYTKI